MSTTIFNNCCWTLTNKGSLLFVIGVVGQEESEIRSNVNLGVHGQGLLELRGRGDSIKAQRLFLSLFYNVIVSFPISCA